MAIAYRGSSLYQNRILLRGCEMSDRSFRTASGQILARPINACTHLQTAPTVCFRPISRAFTSQDIGPTQWKTSAGACFLAGFLGLLDPYPKRTRSPTATHATFLLCWAIVGSSSRPILAC